MFDIRRRLYSHRVHAELEGDTCFLPWDLKLQMAVNQPGGKGGLTRSMKKTTMHSLKFTKRTLIRGGHLTAKAVCKCSDASWTQMVR